MQTIDPVKTIKQGCPNCRQIIEMPAVMVGETTTCPTCEKPFGVRDLVADAARAAELIPKTQHELEQALWARGTLCAFLMLLFPALLLGLSMGMAAGDRALFLPCVGLGTIVVTFFVFQRAWARGVMMCGIALLAGSVLSLNIGGEIGGGFLALAGLGIMFWTDIRPGKGKQNAP